MFFKSPAVNTIVDNIRQALKRGRNSPEDMERRIRSKSETVLPGVVLSM